MVKPDKKFFKRLEQEEEQARQNRLKSINAHWKQKVENFNKTSSYY